MQREPVANSSNIAEIGYDEKSYTLEVLFRSGGLYQYFEVPKQEYEGLRSASSVGAYLSQHIKGKYRYARV
jgi:hypothetical protein